MNNKIILEGSDGKVIATFSDEESEEIRALAQKAGLPPDRYLRRILRQEFRRFRTAN